MSKIQKTWLKYWIRAGYVTKGLIYVIMGCLALLAALNHNTDTPDLNSALQAIADQPLGEGLLILVAIGLAGYALWRFIEAVFGPEHYTTTLKILIKRLGSSGSSIAYAALSLTAIQLILGPHESEDGEAAKFWTARILELPFGQWLVGVGGAGVVVVGIIFAYRAFSVHFRRHLNLQQVRPSTRVWIVNVGRVGLTARSIIIMLIGSYLIQAARNFNPNKVQASEGALRAVKAQPHGPLLLSLVAFGLVAYGIHMGLQARYRRIDIP